MTDRIAIVGIDHVLLVMPTGGEKAARRFYGELLGLREVPKPPELAPRGGCWFVGAGGTAVHLGVDQRFIAAKKAHPCLIVADLDAARRALAAAGSRIAEDETGVELRRFYVEDPFGNRIELVEAADAGFTGRGDGRVNG
jgi:catechol 2,3-dioxygenase-like lactoylglutathione lyase family enzyme